MRLCGDSLGARSKHLVGVHDELLAEQGALDTRFPDELEVLKRSLERSAEGGHAWVTSTTPGLDL